MKIAYKIIGILLFLLVFGSVQAQRDSSDMSFDFGWTRDKDLNLWPLLKFKKDTSTGFVQFDFLFSIYRFGRIPEFQEKYSHLFPIWRRKTNTMESDFRLFSLYYPSVFHKSYSSEAKIRSFDFLEIAPGISALGISKSDDGLYVNNNLLFLLWYNKNELKKSSYLIFFPLYWSFKNQNSRNTLFLPFWLSGNYTKSGFKYTAVSPLFWHFKRDTKSGNILFPLYWNSKNKNSIDPWKVNVLFPIWYSYSSKYYKRHVLLPLIYHFKKPDSKSFTLLPFYSLSKDTAGTRRFLMISPLYWNINSYDEKTRVFLPIWFSFTNDYKKNRTLLPFIFYQKNLSYRSFTFLPLFSYGADSLKSRRHFAITPLFWQFKEHERTINTLFPLFWDIKNLSENNPSHRTVLFPLFFRFHDNEYSRFSIFPVLYKFRNPEYHSFTLLPFVSVGRSNDSSRRHFSVATLYWQFKRNKDTTRILFPLWWYRSYEKWDGKYYHNVIFPIYWSYKNPEHINNVFFPVLWNLKNPYYHSFTFIPLVSFGHSPPHDKKHLMIGPLFWWIKNRDLSTTALFPFLWNTRDKGETPFHRTIVFPLWWSYSDSLRSNRIVFPLFWRFKNPEYCSTTIFPVLSTGKSVDGTNRYCIFTPLYLHFADQESKQTLLFPIIDSKKSKNGDRNFGILGFLFRYKKKDSLVRTDFIWPLCQYKSDNDLKYFRFVPLIWYKKTNDSRFFSIQPFYYQLKNEEYADYHVLWQLFTFRNTYHIKKSWNFLWKTLYYEKYQPKGHEFRFLYLVFADVKKENEIEKSFFPFWYYSKQANGNRSLSLFLYFYNSVRRQLPNSSEFYKEERIFWFIRLRSNYRRLKAEGKL